MKITEKTTAALMDEFLTDILKNMYAKKDTIERLKLLENAISQRIMYWLEDGNVTDKAIASLIVEVLLLGGGVSATFMHQEDIMNNASSAEAEDVAKLARSAVSAQRCNYTRSRLMKNICSILSEIEPSEKTYAGK